MFSSNLNNRTSPTRSINDRYFTTTLQFLAVSNTTYTYNQLKSISYISASFIALKYVN